jgi:hypothetical protein
MQRSVEPPIGIVRIGDNHHRGPGSIVEPVRLYDPVARRPPAALMLGISGACHRHPAPWHEPGQGLDQGLGARGFDNARIRRGTVIGQCGLTRRLEQLAVRQPGPQLGRQGRDGIGQGVDAGREIEPALLGLAEHGRRRLDLAAVIGDRGHLGEVGAGVAPGLVSVMTRPVSVPHGPKYGLSPVEGQHLSCGEAGSFIASLAGQVLRTKSCAAAEGAHHGRGG